jgi:hypothetical protein
MSIIPAFVGPADTAWPERVAERCRRSAVAARVTVAAVICWARSRVEAARADERGLETAEIVLIGSIVLVAVAAIGTALVAWLNGKLGKITGL